MVVPTVGLNLPQLAGQASSPTHGPRVRCTEVRYTPMQLRGHGQRLGEKVAVGKVSIPLFVDVGVFFLFYSDFMFVTF